MITLTKEKEKYRRQEKETPEVLSKNEKGPPGYAQGERGKLGNLK